MELLIPMIAELIPVIIIVMGIGLGMLAIFLRYRRRKDMFALYHQERMAAIDKGIELPPLPEDFFHEDRTPSRRSPHRTLLWGLILAFIGLTLYLALHFTGTRADGGGDVALFALLPGGIGVACLIYYFTVGRRLAEAMEVEQKTRLAERSQGGKP